MAMMPEDATGGRPPEAGGEPETAAEASPEKEGPAEAGTTAAGSAGEAAGSAEEAAGERPEPEAAPEAGDAHGAETPETAETARRLEALEAELAEARRQRDEYLSLLQRLKADFDNFRRRSAGDLARAREEGMAAFVRELLPVVDNLERALASGDDGPALKAGVEMTMKQLRAVFAKHGVEPIEAEGQPFDPQQHEALMQVPAEGRPAGHVAQVFERGYRMGSHLLRPARVAVTGSEEADQNG
ncbi:MAG: nucleotide exchange factor GrpE [Clostridia bacterium]|nr:nucleotide exchange factor GrpE [Clostridia bacterium]